MIPRDLRELVARCRPLARHMREASLLRTELERMTAERDQFRTGLPPGHFYSPIPSLKEARREEARIFDSVPDEIPGVDLNEPGQLQLLDRLTGFYPSSRSRPSLDRASGTGSRTRATPMLMLSSFTR